MLTRISLLLVAVAFFGSVAGVEAGKPSGNSGNKSQPVAKKVGGNNGGNNNNNNGNNNSFGKQLGRQLLNQYVFGNGGGYGNGGWNNGNGGNWNNGCNNNNRGCNNNNNCNRPCNNGPVIVPASEEPPVVEDPATEQPVDPNAPEGQPIDPMGEAPSGEEGTAVGTEEGTPGALKSAGVNGPDLQAKLVKFATSSAVPTGTTLTSTKALTLNKPKRIVYAEIVCGKVAFAGGRTLTIEHDSKPGQQPPTIIAVGKIPAIAAGQVFKFQKELPAGYSLESLRLRMTLSPGDSNAANDTISSRE